MDHSLPSGAKEQLRRLWRCRNLRHPPFSSCSLEKQQEEEIVPTQWLQRHPLFRRIPQIFEILRVHLQTRGHLDYHRRLRPFLRHPHLQEEEEVKRVHLQTRGHLDYHRRLRPFLRHPHLQEEEEV